MSDHTVSERDGSLVYTYETPPIEELTLTDITLYGRGVLPDHPVATVRWMNGTFINGKQVHPFDLIRFCDAILAQYSGKDLARARG